MSASRAALFGDLEQPGELERALVARSARLQAHNGQREIVFTVCDHRHQRWAHNLLLNLLELGIQHTLVIGSSAGVCEMLGARLGAVLGCGHSSFLLQGRNRTIDRGLRAWRVAEDHVYHLWWQRWHYMARAVALGYNALNLDGDISFRADPYPLFHGPLAHRELILGLDGSYDGSYNPHMFPAINVGVAYCQGARRGAAQWVLEEMERRVLAFLVAPPLMQGNTRNVAQQVLWEQDTMKDAIETAVFGESRPAEAVLRHVRMYEVIGEAPPRLLRPGRKYKWRHERLEGVAARAADVVWLPLLPSLAPGAQNETVAGVPQWFFSQYLNPPLGHGVGGAWAAVPSPVLIGHFVTQKLKFVLMRLMGWWHYDLERFADSKYEVRVERERQSAAGGKLLPRRRRLVFPPASSKALVLRRHRISLQPKAAGSELNARGVHRLVALRESLVRFMFLALAVGRRAVLPAVPCAITPMGPRIPRALWGDTTVVQMRNASLCGDAAREPTWVLEPSVAPAESWTTVRKASVDSALLMRSGGCCQLVVNERCLDPYGTQHALHQEAVWFERDLGHLVHEARAADGGKAPPFPVVALSSLVGGANQSLDALWQHAAARVVVVDAEDSDSLEALPPLDRLIAMYKETKLGRQGRLPRMEGCLHALDNVAKALSQPPEGEAKGTGKGKGKAARAMLAKEAKLRQEIRRRAKRAVVS